MREGCQRADIDEIWDYIAADSVVQADAWVDRLDAKLRPTIACPHTSQPAAARPASAAPVVPAFPAN